jgi:hypothetical protein
VKPPEFPPNAPAKPRRKPKGKSPTAHALADLRKLGFLAAVVEKWNPHAKIRQDLFGCIDVIAVMPGIGVLGVQATAGGGSGMSNHNARRRKSAAEPRLRTWLESGGRFEIWSFTAKTIDGRKRYTLHREELKLDDLTSPIMPADEPRPMGPLFATGGAR